MAPNASQALQKIELTILIGTVNRLPLLKKCLAGVIEELRPNYEVRVIDAGSNDGTQNYVRSLNHPQIHLIEDGKKLGQAKSFNQVLKTLESKYVCWISDDNVVTPGALGKAVAVFSEESRMGMVGLKVKDVNGQWADFPYIGGVYKSGVLNINQGMLPMDIFRSVGFFDETFGSYGIDADLTTRVLLAGYKVCLTKDVAVLHYRLHQDHPGAFTSNERSDQQTRSQSMYDTKYSSLCNSKAYAVRTRIAHAIFSRLIRKYFWKRHWRYQLWRDRVIKRFNIQMSTRDIRNLLLCRWVSPLDLWKNRNKAYYLVQEFRKEIIGAKHTDSNRLSSQLNADKQW